VIHAVILTVGDNVDCCCLQAACRSKDGIWVSGAVKHGSCFPDEFNLISSEDAISPLYRIATFKEELSGDEKLLGLISQYINGDEDCGERLRIWGSTDEDVLKKIGQGGTDYNNSRKLIWRRRKVDGI
jgi:hypothetical protein